MFLRAIREFIASLLDSLHHGDLTGHLAAWYEVVIGHVAIGDEC